MLTNNSNQLSRAINRRKRGLTLTAFKVLPFSLGGTLTEHQVGAQSDSERKENDKWGGAKISSWQRGQNVQSGSFSLKKPLLVTTISAAWSVRSILSHLRFGLAGSRGLVASPPTAASLWANCGHWYWYCRLWHCHCGHWALGTGHALPLWAYRLPTHRAYWAHPIRTI